jgi:hypothetical protein
MSSDRTEDRPATESQLEQRLRADLAAGKTIALSPADLASPAVRGRLPDLLDDLSRDHERLCPGSLRLPGYRLLGEIGHGGMSTVYLARHESLHRHVAVKIAPKWAGGSGSRGSSRVLAEAQAMARVNHEHIVSIFDVVELDDTVAITMEWVDGLSAADLLRRLPKTAGDDDALLLQQALGTTAAGKRFQTSTMRFFVRLVHDIARAAHAVHETGLLHLDIKPSNVLIRRDGTPLLADFGVVREIAIDATHTLTFAGTPVYAAPEQLQRQDDRIGPPTDVFGLGITLYELLARDNPLRELDLTRILQTVRQGSLPPLTTRGLPADLSHIVQKAIAPDPAERYPSAQALADDLLAFLEHRPVLARPLGRAQRLQRWVRVEPLKAALLGLLLALVPTLLVLTGYLVWQYPVIAEAQLAERRAATSLLRQKAMQQWLLHEERPDLFEQAALLDPSAQSRALQLLIARVSDEGECARLIAESEPTLRGAAWFDLLATGAKATPPRVHYDTSELDRLQASADATDRFAAAIAAILALEETPSPTDARRALEAIAIAQLTSTPDPLLLGLQCRAADLARDDVQLRAAEVALARRWPNETTVAAWPVITNALSTRQWRRKAAVEPARSLLTAHPNEPWAITLLLHLLSDEPTDERQQLLRRLARLRGKTEAEIGKRTDAGAILARIQDPSSSRRSVLVSFNQLTRAGHVPWRYSGERAEAIQHGLHALTSRGIQTSSTDIWRVWRSFYTRDLEGAAAVAARIADDTVFALSAPEDYHFITAPLVRVLIYSQDWKKLRSVARHWFDVSSGDMRREAALYVALATARLEDHEATEEFLAIALSRPSPKKAWFSSALIEAAWLLVRPGAPEGLRDPARAAALMQDFERYNPMLQVPVTGPWTLLVQAEVRFANGDRAEALRLAKAGQYIKRREPNAPPDVYDRITAALQRYGN